MNLMHRLENLLRFGGRGNGVMCWFVYGFICWIVDGLNCWNVEVFLVVVTTYFFYDGNPFDKGRGLFLRTRATTKLVISNGERNLSWIQVALFLPFKIVKEAESIGMGWSVDGFICWCVYLLMCLFVDGFICWCVYLLMCLIVETLNCWSVELLNCWNVDLFICCYLFDFFEFRI